MRKGDATREVRDALLAYSIPFLIGFAITFPISFLHRWHQTKETS